MCVIDLYSSLRELELKVGVTLLNSEFLVSSCFIAFSFDVHLKMMFNKKKLTGYEVIPNLG